MYEQVTVEEVYTDEGIHVTPFTPVPPPIAEPFPIWYEGRHD